MKKLTLTIALALTASLLPQTAQAADVTLRTQLVYGADSGPGRLAAQFSDDVRVMSDGEIDIQVNFGAPVVRSTETFDAAVSGILDCDMTTGAYQTGKNPAFQFVGDIMGGYTTPYQMLSWLYLGGGLEAANELYHAYDMHLVGWWVHGMESLSSTTPLANPDDFKGWKFRLPQGMGHEIFAEFGASPINMDFGEVPTALETGLIDGADASNLGVNVGLGLYDVAKHAVYPGFHSMPSDHFACNKRTWDALSERHQRIIEVALQKLALQTAIATEVKSNQAAASLPDDKGVTIHNWSEADRNVFRNAAKKAWENWAQKTPEARDLVDSHIQYMTDIGLLK